MITKIKLYNYIIFSLNHSQPPSNKRMNKMFLNSIMAYHRKSNRRRRKSIRRKSSRRTRRRMRGGTHGSYQPAGYTPVGTIDPKVMIGPDYIPYNQNVELLPNPISSRNPPLPPQSASI